MDPQWRARATWRRGSLETGPCPTQSGQDVVEERPGWPEGTARLGLENETILTGAKTRPPDVPNENSGAARRAPHGGTSLRGTREPCRYRLSHGQHRRLCFWRDMAHRNNCVGQR